MSTCCPEFRAALRNARGTVRHLQLQHFEGYATEAAVNEAKAALFALEGNPDPLHPDLGVARAQFEGRVQRRQFLAYYAARADELRAAAYDDAETFGR